MGVVTSSVGCVRKIVVVAFDGATLLDIVGPLEAFDVARYHMPEACHAPYEVSVASIGGGLVRASNGMEFMTRPLHEVGGDIDTLIVPGGGPPNQPPVPNDIVAWLVHAGPRVRRLCAICTGTFILAEAGLIGGRRVTTHWQAAQLLQQRFPDIAVDADPVFVHDRGLWTSAGFSTGSDLALELIEEDFGHKTAIDVARSLVMFMKRTGAQSQLSVPLTQQMSTDDSFSRLHGWLAANIKNPVTVSQLADFVGMSPRNFARIYAARVGQTPGRTIQALRLDAAVRLIATTSFSFKRIAAETGFGDEQNLRRALFKRRGALPVELRGTGHPAHLQSAGVVAPDALKASPPN